MEQAVKALGKVCCGFSRIFLCWSTDMLDREAITGHLEGGVEGLHRQNSGTISKHVDPKCFSRLRGTITARLLLARSV